MKTQGRRYWYDSHGARYVAEDVVLRGGRLQPQHAIWVGDRVEWRSHRQGALVDPFDGPADEWLKLIDGAHQMGC